MTAYNKQALWNQVEAWFEGGPPASGVIDPSEARVHTFSSRGGATWRINTPSVSREERVPIAWRSFATPTAIDSITYGFRWKEEMVTKKDTADGPLFTLPEYFRLAKDEDQKPQWVVISSDEVPAETGLAEVRFGRSQDDPAPPYVTPDDPESCWKKPGPVAGPLQTHLGDGSVVTYYWYRFADQPALLNADLTEAEREELQTRVEKLHRQWKKDGEYLPPPKIGGLADIDPALIVTPPLGLEAGYVPIVTRQAAAE